ncbi:hypothetical protein BC826DRAFT_1050288 [Russula brevipes]|nr:hypothetical protein BC826DRAFT_1050288 [Russula brevipes]
MAARVPTLHSLSNREKCAFAWNPNAGPIGVSVITEKAISVTDFNVCTTQVDRCPRPILFGVHKVCLKKQRFLVWLQQIEIAHPGLGAVIYRCTTNELVPRAFIRPFAAHIWIDTPLVLFTELGLIIDSYLPPVSPSVPEMPWSPEGAAPTMARVAMKSRKRVASVALSPIFVVCWFWGDKMRGVLGW